MFEVTVSRDVAFTRIDGGGTRRVRCADGTVHEFSRFPKLLEVLPPEVAADRHLVTREVSAQIPMKPAASTGGDCVQLTAGEVENLDYPALLAAVKSFGLDAKGRKEDLRERLLAHLKTIAATQD